MPKLVCSICGQEKEVPECCDKSMVLQGKLLCCCTNDCHHNEIPECCGQIMQYI